MRPYINRITLKKAIKTAKMKTALMLIAFLSSSFAIPMEDYDLLVSSLKDFRELEVNPEEMGSYFEGDIIVHKNLGKNGLVAEAAHWEDGVIPYEIAGSFSSKELNVISDAMDAYHSSTCLRFKPRISSDKDYIRITNKRSGCWSSVGKIGGAQEVNLQTPACLSQVGVVMHELMHAAGFMHEQNRAERDEYVDVIWNNIRDGHDKNFVKGKKEDISGFGMPYDFGSVMHYSEKAFSRNGRPTIIPKKHTSDNVQIGQRRGFSNYDIQKIRQMYHCKERNEV